MKDSLPQPLPQILFSSAGRGWNALDAALVHIPAGLAQAPASELHRLGMHFGPPVNADCSVGGTRVRGLQKPGDISFVPAGVDGSWEDDAACQVLRLSLRPALLEQVAEELGRDVAKIGLRPRLQVRDARIEALGWAIKADLEADTPSDPLYVDLLANALAVRLIEIATDSGPHAEGSRRQGMSARQLRMLIEFIESNLGQKLHLANLARVAGISVTRLKTLFRNALPN
jgi:AraC family transcriptional regulator